MSQAFFGIFSLCENKGRIIIEFIFQSFYFIKVPEENVATTKHGASVIVGEARQALLDGDTANYDMERGFTRHPIDDTNEKGIIVKLGMQCIINHLRMLLWDKDNRSYSYYIEVSMDQKDWVSYPFKTVLPTFLIGITLMI